uniref:Uncharacterized protein n=1 Tax=Anguilla anguilla TaxID=7936 RepID=A0A0E9R5Y5_ANGAN
MRTMTPLQLEAIQPASLRFFDCCDRILDAAT